MCDFWSYTIGAFKHRIISNSVLISAETTFSGNINCLTTLHHQSKNSDFFEFIVQFEFACHLHQIRVFWPRIMTQWDNRSRCLRKDSIVLRTPPSSPDKAAERKPYFSLSITSSSRLLTRSEIVLSIMETLQMLQRCAKRVDGKVNIISMWGSVAHPYLALVYYII